MFMVVGIIVMMKIEDRKDWVGMSGFLMWIDLELCQSMRSHRFTLRKRQLLRPVVVSTIP